MNSTISTDKKTRRILSICFCIILSMSVYAWTATYYLDPINGDDNNPGTSEEPWKTIDRAKSTVSDTPNVNPGDTVILQTGEYGLWHWQNYSNDVNWITYRAADDANVVFDEIWFEGDSSAHIEIDSVKILSPQYPGLTNPYEYCVVFYGTDDFKLSNCYIKGQLRQDNYGSGIRLGRQSETAICERITIENTEITNCKYGIAVARPNEITVRGCNIHDISADCFTGADLTNAAFDRNNFWNAKPWYEFSLVDDGNTVAGAFQVGETIIQSETEERAVVLGTSSRNGHLQLYIDNAEYDNVEGGDGYYGFSIKTLTDSVFTGSGLDDFSHNNRVWRLGGSFKVEITSTGASDKFSAYYKGPSDEDYSLIEETEDVDITGAQQWIWENYKVACTFENTTGHTLGDYWVFNAGDFRMITGQDSGATIIPSNEEQALHADLIQLYAYPHYPKPVNNITITNNIFEKEQGQGIFLKQTKNLVFKNNLVVGGFTSHAFSMENGSCGAQIYNNTISLSRGGSAILMSTNWEQWEEGKTYDLYDNVAVDGDANAIYGLKAAHVSSSLNKPGSGANWTTYWEDVTSQMHWDIRNNIICDTLTIYETGFASATVQNNIIGVKNDRDSVLGDLSLSNIYYGDEITDAAQEQIFNNPNQTAYVGDWSLCAGSSAIGNADTSYAPTSDILGNPRDGEPDIGCYEYVSVPESHPPVLDEIGPQSVDENTELSFTVSASYSGQDPLVYSAEVLPEGASFTGQQFSWTPGYDAAGSYEVTFTVSDGNEQDSEIVTITVNNLNQEPDISLIPDSLSKTEGETITAAEIELANDPDGEALTYTYSGWFTSLPYDISYDDAGSHNLHIQVSDGTATVEKDITITVTNINRAPVLSPLIDKIINENEPLSFSVSTEDPDGDTISYTPDDLPSGASFVNQTFTWTPDYTQSGIYSITFTASDGTLEDTETVTITVNNVNRAPVLGPIGNKTAYTQNSLTFTVNAIDPDGEAVEYSTTTLPDGASFSARTFTWTPSDSQAGSYDITFTASDGEAEDSEAIIITVVADTTGPNVSGLSPGDASIQVSLNNLIYLTISDFGRGVDPNTVTIEVDGELVYAGDTSQYDSLSGICRRTGTNASYRYSYQANEAFDYDQTITVAVNASDLGGNSMDEYSYSFTTEMRSFGKNKRVSTGTNNLNNNAPSSAIDSSGNIWAVWHKGQTDSRNIYIGKLVDEAESFSSSIQVTNSTSDQCNPVIAIDSTDKIYVAWQDNSQGQWNIYVSTSVDGRNFSTVSEITDPNSNQVNPDIAIDGLDRTYVVWEDDQNGNKDIYVASSSNDYVDYTSSQITSDTSDQTNPAIVTDSSNTAYVVWADSRNGASDIYGADSANGPWTNVAVVSKQGTQTEPAIAVEESGSILHLLWSDSISGNSDIYYASTNGLPSSPLSGSNLVDDDTGANQSEPAVIVTGSTGNNLRVFACWKDERDVSSNNGDTDIYFVEVNSGYGTNILVGDDGTNSFQSDPVIGVDKYGYPYHLWTDGRVANREIYYAASKYVANTPLASMVVEASSETTLGTEFANVNNETDVSIVIPNGACPHDVKITISKVNNPQKVNLDHFYTPYEFGPSGMEFDEPVTITIPYYASTVGSSPSAYWYNPTLDLLSQEGITDVSIVKIDSDLYALRFKTTHFTMFMVGGAAAIAAGGGGGGGGCSMSPNVQGTVVEFLLPYILLAVIMIILRLRDRRRMKAAIWSIRETRQRNHQV